MTIKINSDVESKRKRGYCEVVFSGVATPSDGMIEFSLHAPNGEDHKFWMTCEKARTLCKMLNDALLYHEEFGAMNVYAPVDRSVPCYNPQDYMEMQHKNSSGEITTTLEFGY